jgi:uncharacterized membrane protein
MTELTNNSAGDARAEINLVSAERLVFFSDAVVAIAITLLALALPQPHGPTAASSNFSNSDLFRQMWAERSGYFAFLISFVVIANHWRLHHRLYRSVARLDGRLITLDLVWLLMIVITPFATKLLSGTGGFGARFTVYAVIQVATILAFLFMRRHIEGHHLLLAGAPEPATRAADLAVLAVAGSFAISIPVALATGSQWAFAIWVAAGFGARAVRRLSAPDQL